MFRISKLVSFNSYPDMFIVIDHADGSDYELNSAAAAIFKKIEKNEQNYSEGELEFIEDLINAGIVFKDGGKEPYPSCKDIRNLESPLWKKLTANCSENIIPLSAVLELTYRCPVECIHCYIDRSAVSLNEEMSFKDYSKFIDEFRSMGGLYIVLTGGDPFLHGDFEKIFNYARERHIAVSVMSSGCCCDIELLKRMSNLGIMSFQASIHGHTAATHDSFTGIRGSFERTVGTLRYLKDSGVYVQAAVIVNRRNIDHFDDIVRLLDHERISYSFNFEMFPKRNGDRSPVELNAGYENILECLLKTGDPGMPRLAGKNHDDPPCNAARSVVSVDPSGDVFPCIEIRKCAGNIKNSAFSDIWSSSAVMENIRDLRISDLSGCPECSLREFCDRCHGNALRNKLEITDHSRSDCIFAELRKTVRTKKDLQ